MATQRPTDRRPRASRLGAWVLMTGLILCPGFGPGLGPATASTAPPESEGAATVQDVAQQGRPATVRLIIGIDISAESPFLSDRSFARKTAERITERVERLPSGSEVSFRTFGAPASGAARLDIDRRILRRSEANDAARLLNALIAGMPQLTENGTISAQTESNIIGFLQTTSRRLDCSAERTLIVLATDGFEDSEYGNLREGGNLPTPERPLFERCARLEMLGLGRGGGSPRLTDQVVQAWTEWAEAAGFTIFLGLDDW